jgi:hypothetical protein
METPEQQQFRIEHDAKLLAECRTDSFVLRKFLAMPSLRTKDPSAWDSEGSFHVSERYEGEPFDPKDWEVIEGGWDHEHCHVCRARINPGDDYWAITDGKDIELCLACYDKLQALKASATNS